MRTRIYFVRHGESRTNIDQSFKGEDTLSDIGISQAKAVAERLKNIPIERIYTSKILRARLTSAEIEKVVGIEPEILDFIQERKGSFPQIFEFKHLPHDEMIKVVREHTYNEWEPSHDEVFDDLKLRLKQTKDFLESLTNKHVVVVSHAVFLKALVSYLMLGDLLTEELSYHIVKMLTVGNTSVSKFEYNHEKNKWRLEYWNDEGHLNVE